MRKKQMSKRLRKYEAIKEEIILPELIGPKDYKYLIVSWGSPYFIIKEAVEKTEKDNIAILHFNWLHPLAEQSKDILEKAEQIIVIENNDTAQFGHYLKNQFCVDFQHTILKNIGLPFSVEELAKKLVEIMEAK
jgi:2-oxoglutarate ferredoxin oxidoreductase subunit alpha